MSSYASATKRKYGQMDYNGLKSFCTPKIIITRLKSQLTQWEKIFASDISENKLIPRIYREFRKLNSQKK
jgi:hypothetical protein